MAAIKTNLKLEAALQYASMGWKVFPIEENGKRPRISTRDGGKGVHDATTDRQTIETWLARFPNANLGYHTEENWVLDIDVKNNGPASLEGLIRTYGPIPETLRASTPSSGTHYYWRTPRGVYVSNRAGIMPGLDSRSRGGYVLLPPSSIDGTEYAFENWGTKIAEAPDWLLALVKESKEGFKKAARSDTGSRDIDDASMAGYLMNGGFSEDETFEALQRRNNNPEQRDVPLPTNEILKTVRSIYKREIHTPAQLRQAIQDRHNQVVEDGLIIPAPNPMWEEGLILSSQGHAKNILANAEACLVHSPLFAGSLAYDEFRAEVILTRNIVDPVNRKPVYHLLAGTVVTEHITREMLILVQRLVTAVTFTEDTFGVAIQSVARQNSFHSVQDWLNGLKWDGVPRIDSWLIDHMGVEDTPYARGVGKRWLISAVGRALKPGDIANSMLILEGPQDAGKSRALRTLAGPGWFKDTPIDFSSKDRFSGLRGVWIYELAEFDQYRGTEAARVKSFMSSSSDTYRPAYGRSDVTQPRGCIFVGSVNPDHYLTDPTGNKRYWPVKIVRHDRYKPIDFAKLEDARDQIWAEAVRCYFEGHAGFINTPDLIKAHEAEALARVDTEDTWEPDVLEYMQRHSEKRSVTTNEILKQAIGVPTDRQSGGDKIRVRRILEHNGFEHKSVRSGIGGTTKAWRKKRALLVE